MKVFVVFDAKTREDWGDRFQLNVSALHPVEGVSYVVIDNDSSPELEPELKNVAGTLGAKVHRILWTPQWQIVRDVLAGQAAAGVTEPTLVALGSDRRLRSAVTVNGLLGPAGDVSDGFAWTSDPVEFAATLVAKTRDFTHTDAFAPAAIVTPTGVKNVPPLGNIATLFGVDRQAYNSGVSLGMRPPAVGEPLRAFYREHLGEEGTRFVTALQEASQIADDFVDDEMPWPWRSRAMRELVETLLLDIPNDPFYQKHQRELEEIVAQCIATWDISNAVAACDATPDSRLWAYIQREVFQMVVWRVAAIVGGRDHARGVLLELQQILHGPHGAAKTFPVWLDETRRRAGRG